MPIMKEPKPLPSGLGFVPAGGVEYRVGSSDSWLSLADRQEVRASGMSALDLCYYNSRTRTPAEINWYLYHKVGCRVPTRNGTNLTFSNADRPGTVYATHAHPGPELAG
jgi:hypothetical protein